MFVGVWKPFSAGVLGGGLPLSLVRVPVFSWTGGLSLALPGQAIAVGLVELLVPTRGLSAVAPSSRGVRGGNADVKSEQAVAESAGQDVRRAQPRPWDQARCLELGARVAGAGCAVDAPSNGVVPAGGLGPAATKGMRSGVVQ